MSNPLLFHPKLLWRKFVVQNEKTHITLLDLDYFSFSQMAVQNVNVWTIGGQNVLSLLVHMHCSKWAKELHVHKFTFIGSNLLIDPFWMDPVPLDASCGSCMFMAIQNQQSKKKNKWPTKTIHPMKPPDGSNIWAISRVIRSTSFSSASPYVHPVLNQRAQGSNGPKAN